MPFEKLPKRGSSEIASTALRAVPALVSLTFALHPEHLKRSQLMSRLGNSDQSTSQPRIREVHVHFYETLARFRNSFRRQGRNPKAQLISKTTISAPIVELVSTYQYQPVSPDHKEIRLLELAPGEFEKPLAGKLRISPINNKAYPEYETTSYV